MMRHQLLGPSGLRVSELCLGADGAGILTGKYTSWARSLEVGLAAEVVSPDGWGVGKVRCHSSG
jgi:hypothetical protein